MESGNTPDNLGSYITIQVNISAVEMLQLVQWDCRFDSPFFLFSGGYYELFEIETEDLRSYRKESA